MARYQVRCEVEVPDSIPVTDKQVEDWVRFNLHENGELRDNPLQNLELEAVCFSVELKRLKREPAFAPAF